MKSFFAIALLLLPTSVQAQQTAFAYCHSNQLCTDGTCTPNTTAEFDIMMEASTGNSALALEALIPAPNHAWAEHFTLTEQGAGFWRYIGPDGAGLLLTVQSSVMASEIDIPGQPTISWFATCTDSQINE